MRVLYNIFFLIFSIVYLPYLLVKGKFHKGFAQKFGKVPREVSRLASPVWIHAVSVGEAALGAKLAGEIKKRYPGVPVAVSVTTRTGHEMILKTAQGAVDAVFYYPLDLSFTVSRVLDAVRPRLYVMVETEIWPNLLEELASRKIPVALVNGRISDRSFANYRKIRFITGRILRCIDVFCMQSEKDAEKIKYLGADAGKVRVTGSMKFDGEGAADEIPRFSKEDLAFAPTDEIIVAGSTHFPEERIIIDLFLKLRAERPGLKLILAPRHVDRADAVGIYIEKTGLAFSRFSDVVKLSPGKKRACDVLLVDTIGHLKELYSVATLVFVGGSIAKRGGQNPIEAASRGKAVIFGNNMSNFREVADIFVGAGAAIRIKDASHMEKVINELLREPSKLKKMAENAGRVIESNKGAVSGTVDSIACYIERKQ